MFTTSDEIHEAIQTTEAGDTDRILDILHGMLGTLQLLTRAVLELETGESDGKPCLTIGTREQLQNFN